jgi:hypothetical protein
VPSPLPGPMRMFSAQPDPMAEPAPHPAGAGEAVARQRKIIHIDMDAF